jgi:hypothetical protein
MCSGQETYLTGFEALESRSCVMGYVTSKKVSKKVRKEAEIRS